MMLSITDRVSRRLFRNRSVGIPTARVVRRMGMHRLSKYISRWCRWAPDAVAFELVSGAELIRGEMFSGGAADHIAWQIWMKGAEGYEPPLPALFSALTRERLWRMSRVMPKGTSSSQGSFPEGGHVLVAGANSGFYVLLAGLGHGARTVHAFEPYPPAFSCLRTNVHLNGLQGKVRLVEAAIGDSRGETSLFIPPPRFSSLMDTLETSASLNAQYHEKVGQVISVPVLTVDEYAKREEGCGIAGMSVMLLDLEGFEHAALQGSAEVLQTSRPIVIFELLKRSTTQSNTIERIRQKHGYRCFVLEQDDLKLSEPVQASEQHANQVMVPEEHMDSLMAGAAMARVNFNYTR